MSVLFNVHSYCVVTLQDGNTPLMVAAYMGHEDTVKELLSSGASPLCSNNVSTCTL